MKKIFLFLVLAAAQISVLAGGIVVSSYPWQKTTVANMLVDFRKSGFDKVSMFQNMKLGGNSKHANELFCYWMSDGAKAEAKKMFAEAGVRVVSIGHIYAGDEARIKQLFDFAKDFGIEVMTVEAQPEALPIYDRYAKEYGIGAGLYNHPYMPESPKALKKYPYMLPEKMLAAIEGRAALKAFPDCGHWGRSGFDIVKCLKQMQGKFVAINIQNLAPDNNCEEYSKGRLPLKEFVEELKRQKFDGYCIVMFNVADDRSQIDKVAPSVKFLEDCGLKK